MNQTLSRRTAARSRARSLAAACATAAVLALTATACSGDGGGTKSSGSASDTEKTREDQMLEHRKCLREQGLDISEPKADGPDGMGVTIGGDGASKEKVEKAFKACEDKAVGGGPKELTQAEKDKMVAFARCMRENGFDMPDPKFDGGALQGAPAPALKSQDMKKFEKADKACESAGR